MINPNPKPQISIIVAQAENRAIGKDNDLLWHLSGDLRRFKQLTMGHTIVMGRRTWESLPKRPLPGRRNIVLTSNADYKADGAEVVHSMASLLRCLPTDDEVFVMGGASLYTTLMPFAQRLYVTWVHRNYEADVYFPVIDLSAFTLINQTERMHDEPSGLDYSYAEYERKYEL